MRSQQPELASLRGTVRDQQGTAVADASVELHAKDPAQGLRVRTDPQGAYDFAALPSGVYTLRVAKDGYADSEIPSVFVAPKEAKTVDVTLGPSRVAGSTGPSTTPQFFDQPKFTVSGVTDTTNLGGHGSDTIVRTRDTIATEAAGLGKPAAKAPSNAIAREESLRETAEHEPRNFDANYKLGKLLIDSGRAKEAISYLERAVAIRPAEYGSAYELALANAEAGNDKVACDQTLSLLALHDKAELRHLLGDVEERLGNSLEAVRQYQRAAEMDPSETYLFDWGSELLLHHAPEPALEVFNRGNQLFPGSVRMLIGIGAAWFARGSNDQAVQAICKASDLNPDDPVPYLFLGKMQDAQGAPSGELITKLKRFVTLQPRNAEANYYYALALWETRKRSQEKALTSEVESLLNTAVHRDPQLGAAHLQLGILFSEQRDSPRAIAEYEKAVRIDPQMEEAHYRLAQAYRQNGDTDKAKEELRRYQQITKQSNEQLERKRHEIKQFVYTLRDQALHQGP